MKTSTNKSMLAVAVWLTFTLLGSSLSMAIECIVSGETELATIEFGGEPHAYYFRGEAGQRAVIEMTDISNGRILEPRIQLIDPHGVRIDDSGWQWERAEIDKKLEKTGIHTIVVSDGYSDVDFGEYTLSLIVTGDTITCPQDRDGEDLTNGFAVNGTMQRGDLDASNFYGRVGQGFWIECVDLSAERVLEPRVRLYGPNGERVADSGWQWERATIENYQLEMTGIYTFIVSDGYSDVDAGDFGLFAAVMRPIDPHGRYPYGPQPADGQSIDYCDPNYQFTDIVVENMILPDGAIVTRRSGAYLLSWWSVIDATGYDVYFASASCMPLEMVAENIRDPFVPMPAVEGGQVCSWRVVAHTPGGDIQGPTWWFSVESCRCSLIISAIGQGSIVDPNVGFHEYPCGEVVTVKAVAEPNYEFVRWEGTAVDANKVIIEDEGPTGFQVSVTVDDAYTLTAVFEEVIYDDSDPGWIMEGQWEFGVPTGQGGEEYGNPDPTSGYTGPNVFGVNLNGDYDVEKRELYSLRAGPFDLSGYSDVNLRFARWLNTDEPRYVTASVNVSIDEKKNWPTLWESETEITDSQWVLVKYSRGAEVDGQSGVYLRWTYQVVDERAYPYSGWNIDDIQLCGKRQYRSQATE